MEEHHDRMALGFFKGYVIVQKRFEMQPYPEFLQAPFMKKIISGPL
jgi:hypothetical protein